MQEEKVNQKGVKDIKDSIWSVEYSIGMGDAGGCGCCLPSNLNEGSSVRRAAK